MLLSVDYYEYYYYYLFCSVLRRKDLRMNNHATKNRTNYFFVQSNLVLRSRYSWSCSLVMTRPDCNSDCMPPRARARK